jgi:hypothetical protein
MEVIFINQIDVIEIDPVVYESARKHFRLSKPSNVYLKDGRQVIDELTFSGEYSSKRYDFVLHDVFTGGLVYPSLFSIESLAQIIKLLKQDGVLAMNFVGEPASLATHTIYATLKKKFQYIRCFLENPDSSIFQNIVFFASMQPISFDFSTNEPKTSNPVYNNVKKTFQNQYGNFCDKFPAVGPITDRNNPLKLLQYQSALKHWEILREILPNQDIWNNHF